MTSHPQETDNVSASAVAYIGRARHWAKTLEDKEAERIGSVEKAREIVARRTGALPGTLENLRRNRLKTIATHIYERLRATVISELLAEKARIDHELQIALQTGVDPASPEMAEILADAALVRKALGLDGGG